MEQSRIDWLSFGMCMAIIAAASIFIAASPETAGPMLQGLYDYIAIEFGVFAATCLYGATRGFDPSRRPGKAKAAVLAVSIAVAYGAFDELHQSFVPGRDVSFRDWISDSIGALIVVFVLVLVWSRSEGSS